MMARAPRPERRQLPRWGRGLVGVVVVVLIAEAFTRAGPVNPAYLPPVSDVLLRVVELLTSAEFLGQVARTLQAWAIGLGLAVAVGVPAGVVLGSSSFVYSATRAIVEFLRPIPSVALIPLAILLFGLGTEMKVSLVVYASLWPILFNTIYGMHDVDPVAKDTARVFGFGRLAVLTRVSLPSAAPFIYTGVRIAAAVALILALSAEILGARHGLGQWIVAAGAASRADLVYAGVVVTGLLGFLINWVTVIGERRLFGWQPALREAR
jgi:NitT/TauT family transport system permease protein